MRDTPVGALLAGLHERHAGLDAGEVASYIPELATAEPDWFGICLVTADGATYEVGETERAFTIQSISKPITFALALEDLGEEAVRRKVDVEPSGEAFNSITLHPGTGVPLNPMVNAGAIATASLIRADGGEPIDRILRTYSAFAGRELSIDESVWRSESETSHRNRAIAHLLRNSNVIEDDPEAVLQTYFRQCSTLVDCRDLATIAATLAAAGVNPVTHERVVSEDTVQSVLSVMASCGMYDSAGDWLYHVGLPAKSGVAGGIVAVIPGQLGIAVYSPPLDEHGNSVRGIRVCRDISDELGLHVMNPPRRPPPPVRASHSLRHTRSRRIRSQAEQRALAERGGRARAFELQGEISFAAGELVTRQVMERVDELELVVLDLSAVRSIDPLDVPIFAHLLDACRARDTAVLFSGAEGHEDFVEALREASGAGFGVFEDLDQALEWCESALLEDLAESREGARVPLQGQEAVRGMDEGQLRALSAHLSPRGFRAGEVVASVEEPVEEIMMIVSGRLSVMLDEAGGGHRRVSTLAPGMTVGEVAVMTGAGTIGTIRADTDVEALALPRPAIEELRREDPDLVVTLLENFMRLIGLRMGQLRAAMSGLMP